MKRLCLILPLIFVFACEDKDETKDEILDSVQLAKEKWDSKNIASYNINLSVNCFCHSAPPIGIKVDDDIITAINGKSITQAQLENEFWYAKSVDDLFVFIEKNLAQEPYQNVLRFNSTYGYPEEAWFDLEEMMADEEIGYIISSFKIY